ncbi:MAG: hypothetical protein U0516_00600 [Candidatus Saccharibacteria bacterium]
MSINTADVQAVLKPSIKRIAWTFGIAVVLLIILNINLIILQSTSNTILAQSDVQDSIISQLQAWTSSPILNLAILVIFWVCVGLIAYSIIYAIYSLATEAQNEVVVEEEYVNRGETKKRLKGSAYALGIIGGIIILGLLSLRILVPLWNSWFENFILGIRSTPITAILYLLASLIGLGINVYLFEILINWSLYLE